jgi:hypothetical protein
MILATSHLRLRFEAVAMMDVAAKFPTMGRVCGALDWD